MDKRTVFILMLSVMFSKINGYLHLDKEPLNPAFDQSFYENDLDPELCQQQLGYIKNNTVLGLQFIESGMRVPRGILMGNTMDWGNYLQCLAINHKEGPTTIEGKYCSITVPFNQNIQLPDLPTLPDLPDWIPEWLPELIPEWIEQLPDWIDFDPRKLKVDKETMNNFKSIKPVLNAVRTLNGDNTTKNHQDGTGFTLAVCVPKPCTTREGIDALLFNLTSYGFTYRDNFCRLNNDKPWVPADYVAIAIFSFLGLITLFSTGYDIWHSLVIKSDPKCVSTLYTSFSLYTNARRLTTFTTSKGALECVDGIRVLSMIWVILGHTFLTLPPVVNLLDSALWTTSLESIWITASPISVDTFFMISGMLLVYTTAGKMTGMKLLKNLHLFYINRIIRMFPLLAAGILLQVSVLHRIADGPYWGTVAESTENCRNYWWSTLIYLQNFVNAEIICLPHSWYLAIDMQMYILCPVILYWVLGENKTIAWSALLTALLAILVGSSVYIFVKEFPGSSIQPARADEGMYYMIYYYLNTLTRASPIFVGMIFGYLLHLWRGKTLEFSKVAALLLWCCIGTILLAVIFSSHPMKNLSYDNQTFDSLVNAFHRPLWAFGVGLMIFVCHHGYGGPVNWLLSLQLWKLPSRLSYGMYIFHYPIMFVTSGTHLQPIYFSQMNAVFRFLSDVTLALLVSFVLTLFIDSPFSALFKLLLGGGKKETRPITQEIKNGKQNGLNNIDIRSRYNANL